MNKFVMPVMVLAMLLVSSAIAQPPKQQSVVTNGELTAGKEFHLLLIHDGGSLSVQVAGMLNAPRGPLVDWVRACNVRIMAQSEPQVMENHADLMQKHQGQMPILAMVQQTDDDGRGAVWCSVAGNQVPTNEQGLASWLGTYYHATLAASNRTNQSPAVATNRNLQQSMPYGNNGGSYFMPRGTGAPDPYVPGGGRRPLISPNVNVDVQVPDALNTSLSVNRDTQSTLIVLGCFLIVCCLILGGSMIISAVSVSNAITNDDDNPTPAANR
jgi:hypothetical protein